eukprot:408-Heterococcus_DN1.PRE.1
MQQKCRACSLAACMAARPVTATLRAHQKQSVWHAAWRRKRLNRVGAVHNHVTATSPLSPLSDCLPRYYNVV